MIIILLLGAVFGIGITPAAGSIRDTQHYLNSSYKNQTFIIRDFYSGSELTYDSNGNLLKGGQTGPWTTDAMMQVDRIHLNHTEATIGGFRLWVAFAHGQRKLYKAAPITINIKVGHDPITLSDLAPVFKKIFLTPKDPFSDLVPSYWQKYLKSHPATIDNAKSATVENKPVPKKVKAHKNATAIKVLSVVKPVYTPAARAARYEGTVVLSVIIDKNGTVSNIDIAKPIGMGLDDAAVKAVRQWKYSPPTLNGAPAEAFAFVDVRFNYH